MRSTKERSVSTKERKRNRSRRKEALLSLALAVTLVVVIEVKGVVLREVVQEDELVIVKKTNNPSKEPPKERSKATLGVSPNVLLKELREPVGALESSIKDINTSAIQDCKVYSNYNDVFTPYEVYDNQIKYWVKYYSLGVPWYWVKAQLIQESSLQCDAVSYMGAKGLGQFMPKTWRDMEVKLWDGEYKDVFNPIYNIQATVYYNKWLMSQWRVGGNRTLEERWSLTLASYNAGLGNILKAQRKAGSNHYKPMEDHLHKVTGIDNSKQTRDYVFRIRQYSRRLKEQDGGDCYEVID